MASLKPKRKLLIIWRAYLILGALIPAFLISLFCTAFGTLWTVLTVSWITLFVFFYAFYFPLLHRRKSFSVEPDRIVSRGGVMYQYNHSLPIANIQYVTVVTSPLERFLRICSLVVVAPGGRMVLPGLDRLDGENLVMVLTDQIAAGRERPGLRPDMDAGKPGG